MLNLQNFNGLNIEAEFDDAVFEENTSYSGFPLHVLPNEAQEFIREAQKRGLNPDLLAASMLGTVSGALGSNFKLTTDGQKPALWIALVAPSGTGKTPVLNLAVKPLIDHDSKLRMQGIIPLSSITDTSPKKGEPQYRKGLIVSDFTPEALGVMQAIRPRGICIVVNELAQLFNQFNRYTKKSGESQLLMNAWDANSPVTYDRVKGSLVIVSPYLPMLGTIQPSEARRIFEDGRESNGFSHRMLFVYLPDLKKERRSTDPIPSHCTDRWEGAITRLINLDDGVIITMQLSHDARLIYEDFINVKNRELVNSSQQERLKGLHSKFDLHTLRLSVVIHAMKWAYQAGGQFPTQIEADTMKEAIEVAEFFRANSLQMIEDGVGTAPSLHQADKKMALYNLLPENFTTAEAVAKAPLLNVSQKTIHNYLRDNSLYTLLRFGNYQKVPL